MHKRKEVEVCQRFIWQDLWNMWSFWILFLCPIALPASVSRRWMVVSCDGFPTLLPLVSCDGFPTLPPNTMAIWIPLKIWAIFVAPLLICIVTNSVIHLWACGLLGTAKSCARSLEHRLCQLFIDRRLMALQAKSCQREVASKVWILCRVWRRSTS